MKQLIQNLKTGRTTLEDIPIPSARKGTVVIQTSHSLVSLGTERMLVEFGRANLVEKARQQPERVKLVLDKIQSDGLLPTLEAVFNKLDQPLPLGYCNAGTIIRVGEGVTELHVGDRVASNGPHAEYVCVPQNLVAVIPEKVTNEEGAFAVIGAIGLQGIRLTNPTLGETVVVIGLGLVGLLTAQLLRANGCKVLGIDVDDSKLILAERFGVACCNGATGGGVKWVESQTGGNGADAVVITASAKSNDIISQAARMTRKRGRIVLVGVIGLEINRAEFYEKELTFQVSCSYGPGRYDETYEQQGKDYPLPFVRWTEKRNFETVLQTISSGGLDVKSLITERIPVEDFAKVYDEIGQSKSVASLLVYEQKHSVPLSHAIQLKSHSFAGKKGVVGIIGAGNFTKMTLLPALGPTEAILKSIASANGVSGTTLARKYGLSTSTTDYHEILNDNEIDLVLITTRHHLHAGQVVETLKARKHVFVEKPLALNEEQLTDIINHYQTAEKTILHVGFNRRFSPHSIALKKALGDAPMHIVATMNAGFIPSNSWVHDPETGGGRILGEACHLIDLCSFFTGSRIVSVCANALGTAPPDNSDNASILIKYENGSNAVINYFANGNKAYAKERVEVFSLERTAIIDNFMVTRAFGFTGFKSLKTSLDKGHKTQFVELVNRVKTGGEALIPFDSLVNTTRAAFATIRSLKESGWVAVG